MSVLHIIGVVTDVHSEPVLIGPLVKVVVTRRNGEEIPLTLACAGKYRPLIGDKLEASIDLTHGGVVWARNAVSGAYYMDTR